MLESRKKLLFLLSATAPELKGQGTVVKNNNKDGGAYKNVAPVYKVWARVHIWSFSFPPSESSLGEGVNSA